MGVGRFFCVALPLILTIASLVALLIATLSGISGDSLFMFEADLSHFSIDPSDLSSLANLVVGRSTDIVQRSNLTAADLNLDYKYQVGLWNWCLANTHGHRHCTTPEFDWASKQLNTSFLDSIGKVADDAGVHFDIPKDIENAIKAFRTGVKWLEVAYIAANVALGIELALGLFAICSRGVSCITWLVASIASVLVCIAAGATTALAILVVGAIKAVGDKYDIKSSVGTSDLAAVWIAAAFAIGATATWIFTICCCKPEHRSKGYKHRSMDNEKLLPSSYAPLSHENGMSGGNGLYNQGYSNDYGHGYNNTQPQYAQFETEQEAQYSPNPRYPSGTGRSDLAYEPYSHRT